MLYGAPITIESLSKLPSNQGKTVTVEMCAKAAEDQKGTHQIEVQQRLDQLKDEYGNGYISVLIIINYSVLTKMSHALSPRIRSV